MNTIEEKLSAYEALLRKWQTSVNLVGPETLADAKTRHFADSAQLAAHIPADAKTLFDLGSGAGFPGMVLAMLRPDLDVHLIESDGKKCSFLRTVSRETSTHVTIHNERIEGLSVATLPVPDIITARALAPLDGLLDYAWPLICLNPSIFLLFLKGEKTETEIREAQQHYKFSFQTYKSATTDKGHVVEIKNIRKLSEGFS